MTTHLPAKTDILRAVMDQRRLTLTYLGGLDHARFDVEALPGWRVREVLGHLISTDRAAVTGTILPVVFGSMEKLEAWNDRQVGKWADRDPADLLVALDRWGRRFIRLASAIPGRVYQVRMPTLWGRGPGGMLVFSRAYDEWIHRQDIRRALGEPDEDVDLAPVGEFLMNAIGMDTVPALAGARGRVAISLSEVPLPAWSFDLASGSSGPNGETADATIEAAGPGFVMAAAGRGAFEELQARGQLSVFGDQELGRTFLSKLRIV
jgi:uncharacterized protein (TIGR03083 family)